MGLYCKNNSISEERMVEVRQELILLLKCTSSRSECFNKVFEVRSCGILGGRSNFKEEIQKGQEVMILRESEISRRHFQVNFHLFFLLKVFWMLTGFLGVDFIDR